MALAYQWRVLALAMTMQCLVVGTGIYSFAFFVVPWMEDFAVQRSYLMLGYSGSALAAVALNPLAGMLIDRFSTRLLVMGGITAFSSAMALIALAPTPLAVVLLYATIVPLGLVLAGPLMSQTLVARAFEQRRGRAIGLCSLGTSIGGFLLPLVVTQLLGHYHWRTVFMVLAAAIALLLPLAFRVLADAPGPAHKAGDPDRKDTAELLRDSDVFKLAVAFLVPSILFLAVLQNIGLHAQELAVSQRQAGAIVAATALLMAVGKVTFGSLADRLNQRILYYCLASLAGIATLMTAMAEGLALLAAGVLILGVTTGGIGPLLSSVAARHFGVANFGRVIGVVMAFASIGGLSPLVASWIRDASDSYQPVFLGLAPLVLISLYSFSRLSQPPTGSRRYCACPSSDCHSSECPSSANPSSDSPAFRARSAVSRYSRQAIIRPSSSSS